MNDGFKQRLVGAIVLACVALILWPLVFSDPNNATLDRRSQIPEMPVFDKYTATEPLRPDNIEPVADAPIEETIKPKPKPKPKQALVEVSTVSPPPQQDERGLPKSWVLQVASFGQASNAKELKLALQKKGYKAFTRKIKTKEGPAIRVYIGPKFSDGAFSKDKSRIDKAFSVNSIVVRFSQ